MAKRLKVIRRFHVGARHGDQGLLKYTDVQNLAVLKNGRAKAVRFTTLSALCEALECQPGDLLRWEPEDPADPETAAGRDGPRFTREGQKT